jgi:predicted nucleotidyltransferase
MAKRSGKNLKTIKRFLKKVNEQIRIDKVILFGSFARGKQKKWSDIDLAIISDDFKGIDNFERLVMLGKIAWYAKATEIEALGYTKDEYKNATRLDFLGEIKRTGKVIYSK